MLFVKKIGSILVALLLLSNSWGISLGQQSDPAFIADTSHTYEIQESGATKVTHEISITNKTPVQFVQQYAIQIEKTQISNLKAYSESTEYEPELTYTPTTTTISVKFPDSAVGQDKKRTFYISYLTEAVATVSPTTLEIRLPKISPTKGPVTTLNKQTRIITPLAYGTPTQSSAPTYFSEKKDKTILTTIESQATDTPLVLFFGSKQQFDVKASFLLDNPSDSQKTLQVALPPDTSWQRVKYKTIEPTPDALSIDLDGNWIATFQLEPRSQKKATVDLQVTTSLQPFSNTPVIEPLPQHIQTDTYWETADSSIIQTSQTVTSPKAITDFVSQTLQYPTDIDYSQPRERLGAQKALQNPTQSVCQEFSDVFITMARAAKIPARRLTGFAYSSNTTSRPTQLSETQELHAWADYFDNSRNGWYQVDPTWQHTTGGQDYFNQFDLNHLTFAINGTSSTTPEPLGLTSALSEESIEVTLSQKPIETTLNGSVEIMPLTILGWAVPGEYIIEVTNQTGFAWYDTIITSTDSRIPQVKMPPILPWQKERVSLSIGANSGEKVVFSAASSSGNGIILSNEHIITSSHPFVSRLRATPVISSLALGGTTATITTGGILVFRQLRKRSIRR